MYYVYKQGMETFKIPNIFENRLLKQYISQRKRLIEAMQV